MAVRSWQPGTNNGGTGSRNLSILVPSWVAGDILVAVIYSISTTTPATPTGWTFQGTQNAGAATVHVYSRTASAEPSFYTWLLPTTTSLGEGFIVAVSGMAAFESYSTYNSFTDGQHANLFAKSARARATVLTFIADHFTSAGISSAPDLTWRAYQQIAAAPSYRMELLSQEIPDATATGAPATTLTFSGTWDASTSFMAFRISLLPVAATLTITAAPSGTGGVNATGTIQTFDLGAAAIAGAGALAATGGRIAQAQAVVAGSGAVAAAATRTTLPVAGVVGQGGLSAAGTRNQPLAASLGGQAATQAQARYAPRLTVELVYDGVALEAFELAPGAAFADAAFTVAQATVDQIVDWSLVSLRFTGTVEGAELRVSQAYLAIPGTAIVYHFGAAAPAGMAVVTATGSYLLVALAAPSGAGALAGAGTRVQPLAAAMAGTAAFAATGTRIQALAGTCSGQAALAATGQRQTFANAALAGAALVAGDATVTFGLTLEGDSHVLAVASFLWSGQATIAGQAALAASGTRVVMATASCAGSGGVLGAGLVLRPIQAILAAQGALGASLSQRGVFTAVLSGHGAVAAEALAVYAAHGALAGQGAVAANGSRFTPVAGVAAGHGALTGTLLRFWLGAATLSGQGHAQAFAVLQKLGNAHLTGLATLSAQPRMTLLLHAAMGGHAALVADSSQVQQGTARLAGDGLLQASMHAIYRAIAVLRGLSAIAEHPQPITDISIDDVLAGRFGPVALTWRFERRTKQNQFLEDVTAAFVDGSVDGNNDRAIFRAATFTIDPVFAPALNPLADHIALLADVFVRQPYKGLQTITIPAGLFALNVPQKKFAAAGGETWSVAASDVGIHLVEALTPTPYVIAAGTNYLEAARAICDSLGVANALGTTTLTLPVDRTWDMGVPWLTIVNDLLAAINYYSAKADAQGVLRSRPNDGSGQADVVYSDGLWLAGDIDEEVDTTRFANQVVATVNDPARAPLSSVRTNTDPDSPISTISLGRTITKPVAANGAPDQATLDAIAEAALRDAAGAYRKLSITTQIDPRREAFETYSLIDEAAGYAGELWQARNWSFSVKDAAGSMKHTVSRVEAQLV